MQFDEHYFNGIGYDNYRNCEGILERWAHILMNTFFPTSVLDAGCAYNFVAKWFNKHGIDAIGYDISTYVATISPDVKVAPVKDIPEPDNSWDIVTCTEVMEHIPIEDIDDSLRNLYRIARRYIVFIIAFGNEEFPDGDRDPTHITLRTRKWWEDKFKELGMKRNSKIEEKLNRLEESQRMLWSGRFFVIEKEVRE